MPIRAAMMGSGFKKPPDTTFVRRSLLCLLAVAPFWTVYVHHYLAGPGVPTGFIGYDMAYYSANGRAVFERGNGLAYPNASDYQAAAPVIYFHWLPWILGFGIVKLGFDPGIWFVALGALGGFACAWLTLRLVQTVLPEPRFRSGLFLVAMWGGGLICLQKAYLNLLDGYPLDYVLFYHDPEGGWWFLNWGRNLLYPTEAIYHALAAACWLGVLAGRWPLALASAALLATTHPFTGLQMLLILFTWLSIELVAQRGRQGLLRWALVSALLALMLDYYFWFLPSFDAHRALQKTWKLDWKLEPKTTLLAYGPIAALAVCRLAADHFRLSRTAGFLLTCFGVSFALANHNWFMASHQPLHFTRGYVWLPLCLLALPVMQRVLIYLGNQEPRWAFYVFGALAFAVCVSDNLGFLIHYDTQPNVGLYLTRGEREMFDWIAHEHLQGVLLASDHDFSYLAATYTRLRPFYGHLFNTPDPSRRDEADWWFGNARSKPWFADIDYVLVESKRADAVAKKLAVTDPRRWYVLHQNPEWTLFANGS